MTKEFDLDRGEGVEEGGGNGADSEDATGADAALQGWEDEEEKDRLADSTVAEPDGDLEGGETEAAEGGCGVPEYGQD